LIQELIPLGLLHVQEVCTRGGAVGGTALRRQGGQPGVVRYGKQPGSIYLADQKLWDRGPRLRNLRHNREVPLRTDQQLSSRALPTRGGAAHSHGPDPVAV